MKRDALVYTIKHTHPAKSLTYLSLYQTMLTIRLAEEKIAELVSNREIICPCHLYIGQEAVAAGVCSALRKDDWVFSTHRSHGHYLAKGGNLNSMMAELFGRSAGCSGGRGGSMHLADPAIGFPGSSAIVAGTIPLAVGAALSFKLQEKDSIAVAFFGDGAVSEGIFYESLNFASLVKLPVVFICENNLYSTHLPVSDCLADTSISKKASIFNMPGSVIDGNDVLTVYRTALKAIQRARNGKGPSLIECLTYRWLGHVGPSDDLDKGLRNKNELVGWKKKCPVNRFGRYLIEEGIATQDDLDKIGKTIENRIRISVNHGKRCNFPAKKTLTGHVFKD